jgi:hypothetical protein
MGGGGEHLKKLLSLDRGYQLQRPGISHVPWESPLSHPQG